MKTANCLSVSLMLSLRLSKASYGVRPAYAQFTLDRARVVDSPDLEQNKQSFAELFVQRPAFTARYGQTSSCSDFTDALIANVSSGSGVDLTARRSDLIGECNIYAGDTKAQRSQILRKLVELPEYQQRFSGIVTRDDSVCAPQ